MHDNLPIEERKKKLIAQGAAFRAQVILAKNNAHASLHPDRFVKGALNHITGMAMAAFKNGSAAHAVGMNLPEILPLVVTGISALSKRSLLKPVLRGAVIAGTVAAIAMLVLNRKKRASAAAAAARRT